MNDESTLYLHSAPRPSESASFSARDLTSTKFRGEYEKEEYGDSRPNGTGQYMLPLQIQLVTVVGSYRFKYKVDFARPPPGSNGTCSRTIGVLLALPLASGNSHYK